jgi:N-acetylglutamate synthase-like GNAT family acetyltransferase
MALPVSKFNGAVDGRIRRATRDDVPAITRLVRRAGREASVREADLIELAVRGDVIVLGVEPSELVAMACVTRSIELVVVDPDATGLDARMRSVAAALAEAVRRRSAARAAVGDVS